ncbi:MAG: SH3 domain-containing protein [Hyphomicrobiaceae bacterium]
MLNLRSGPSVKYGRVGTIPPGSGCVHKTKACWRRWCKVEYAGKSGWANTRYLQYIP